ncbi:hypothetical protein FZEAL_3675 [Fusarium zealandicum]|uniref:MYND-type domain-containing protein n=1 Tax=Fusarium zealandicum TaxID=1053134 RepID=A0A8H4UP49_9HYPO|nr:hypothetical protein FZEAL_3675 [Fusarium zealandicum]
MEDNPDPPLKSPKLSGGSEKKPKPSTMEPASGARTPASTNHKLEANGLPQEVSHKKLEAGIQQLELQMEPDLVETELDPVIQKMEPSNIGAKAVRKPAEDQADQGPEPSSTEEKSIDRYVAGAEKLSILNLVSRPLDDAGKAENPVPEPSDKPTEGAATAPDSNNVASGSRGKVQQGTEGPQETENGADAVPRVIRFPYVEPMCPRVNDEGVVCEQKPNLACPLCLLVAYCSAECQQADWLVHSIDCVDRKAPSEELMMVDETDRGFQEPLHWAKYAAVDVLNLEKNEGADFSGNLQILFAGGSGLRHLLTTVTNIPTTANPTLCITLNQGSVREATLTLLSLMLLTDKSNDPAQNAEAVVHLWYSTVYPLPYLRLIHHFAVRPLLEASKDLDRQQSENRLPMNNDSFPVVISRGNATIVVELSMQQWFSFIDWAKQAMQYDEGTSAEAYFARIQDRKYGESSTLVLPRMGPARANGYIRWRAEGRLLPFGHPRHEFVAFNSLFINDKCPFPRGCTEEPLTEWSMSLLHQECGPARNDAYGKMFYYVRSLCYDFHQRIHSLNLEFTVMSKHMSKLPLHFTQRKGKRFDRIEAGPTLDCYPLLVVTTLGFLLQHADINPNATLLTVTRESVDHKFELESVQKDLAKENELMYESSGTKLDDLAPPIAREDNHDSRPAVRRKLGLLMWRSWDKFSEHYLNAPHYFVKLSKHVNRGDANQGITATAFAGLEFKQKNTITRRWPNRLVHGPTDAPSLLEFDRWVSWGYHRPERWLEWKKVADVRLDELVMWHELALKEVEASNRSNLESFDKDIDKALEIVQANNAKRAKEAESKVQNTPNGTTEEGARNGATEKSTHNGATGDKRHAPSEAEALGNEEVPITADKSKKKKSKKKKKKA